MKVFWSWQSDTPGRIGRHFIREAIEEAISAINAEKELNEPSARDLELDHDRKGVPGSPDLASTIFSKIDSSEVFIADVTSVAETYPTDSESKLPKKTINANVAIELGYALKSLGDTKIILVMNEHYGGREDLPFDLRHKAGPITFNLPAVSDKDAISAQQKILVSTFKSALAHYLSPSSSNGTQSVEYHQQPDKGSFGFFFEDGDSVGQLPGYERSETIDYSFEYPSHLFLRMIPANRSEEAFSRTHITESTKSFDLCPFDRESNGYKLANKYGIAVISPRNAYSEYIGSMSQVFRSGEIWGINQKFVVERDGHRFLPTGAIRSALTYSLKRYASFLKTQLGIDGHVKVIFGARHLEQCDVVAWDGFDWAHQPMLDSSFSTSTEVTLRNLEWVNTTVDDFTVQLFDLAGIAPTPKDLQTR